MKQRVLKQYQVLDFSGLRSFGIVPAFNSDQAKKQMRRTDPSLKGWSLKDFRTRYLGAVPSQEPPFPGEGDGSGVVMS